MQRFFYAVVMFFIMAGISFAQGEGCPAKAFSAIESSLYFSDTMKVVDKINPRSVTFENKTDPRFVVNFTGQTPANSDGYSISKYISKHQTELQPYIHGVQQSGRWIDFSSFPFEPVAWRVIERTRLENIGEAISSTMFIRISAQCLIVATSVSPGDPSLLASAQTMLTSIAELRPILAQYGIPTEWESEDTTPVGFRAFVGGYASPMAASLIAFLLIGSITALEPPGNMTRIVLGSATAVCIGMAALQAPAYIAGFHLFKHIDNMLIFITCAAACVFAFFLKQRGTTFALMLCCVTGMTLCTLSYLEWTPNTIMNGLAGISLVFMGGIGFLAWSYKVSLPARR